MEPCLLLIAERGVHATWQARRRARIPVARNWYPQRDSNPCCRRERPESWAARRWGPGDAACPRKDSNLRPPAPEAGALSPELRGRMKLRVSDGARTRDLLCHKQALCQLSYTHHAAHTAAFVRWRLEPDAGTEPATSFLPRTRSATELNGQVLQVPPAGFKPAARGLEGRCSIR